MLLVRLQRTLRPHVGRRGYRPSVPSIPETQALLQKLERTLQEDPTAASRLGALLSPATSRNLLHALSTVRKAKPATRAAGRAGITLNQQELPQTPSSAAVGGAAAAAAAQPPPATVSLQDLQAVALQVGLPFIGFGFVDNAIMILAGDYIDLKLGVTLGISSMAAAGIGNTISDVAGLGLGNVVEDTCARLGLPIPALTQEQLMLKQTRWAKVAGSSIGVTIGCLLGMTPLLFLETREDRAKKEEEATASGVQVA
ncbi:hypothetical protein PybrP1_002298 [[Pythium] brassicae (nom. inval.)]|nr:hypothetical protein PybrP1_002298 [[Pythium] brassicae (nom. inval.)]